MKHLTNPAISYLQPFHKGAHSFGILLGNIAFRLARIN